MLEKITNGLDKQKNILRNFQKGNNTPNVREQTDRYPRDVLVQQLPGRDVVLKECFAQLIADYNIQYNC